MYELMQHLIAFKYACKINHWSTDNYSKHLLYDRLTADIDTWVDELSENYFMAENNKTIFDSLEGDQYFKRLMEKIAEFFVSGKPSVDPEQTCTVCAIVEALRAAEKTPGKWVDVLR